MLANPPVLVKFLRANWRLPGFSVKGLVPVNVSDFFSLCLPPSAVPTLHSVAEGATHSE